MSEKKVKVEIELTPEQLELLKSMVRPEDLPPPAISDRDKIGRLMKQYRRQNELTAKEIADKIGFKNSNYISMIESGKSQSKAPVNKIKFFADAYQADVRLKAALLRVAHPDIWSLFLDMMHDYAGIDPGNFDREIAQWVDDALVDREIDKGFGSDSEKTESGKSYLDEIREEAEWGD